MVPRNNKQLYVQMTGDKMSDITFIVANKRSNSSVDGVAGSKYFTDCTVDIQHEFANTVTEHPVETGESFSDHVQRRNNRFTVNGVFSEIPLRGYQGDTLPIQERVKAAYDFLKRLRDERLKFTLVSKYESYQDCVVENLSIPTTAENSSSLFFTLSIVQIRTAKTTLVNIVQVDNVRDDKKDDASKNGSSGKKNTNENLVAWSKELVSFFSETLEDTKEADEKIKALGKP